jgi:two-component system, LuxR family, response regulator FixJ
MTFAEDILIFVVDDDDAVRDSLKILLESHGMAVRDFRSTQDFSDGYYRHPRACLILDLHLPVVGGLEFLALHRTAEMDLPVIMITGRGDGVTEERARELGVLAFLEKPLDDGRLMAAIGDALGMSSAAP